MGYERVDVSMGLDVGGVSFGEQTCYSLARIGYSLDGLLLL
jgi:hypothetical protein